MTESKTPDESFPKYVCMFDITVLYSDSNTSRMTLSLINVSDFEC